MKKLQIMLAMFLAVMVPVSAADFAIHGTTDKDVAIYKPGEKMVFTLKVLDAGKPVAGKKLKWKRTGDDGKTEQGEGIADENGLKVTASTDKPGFVRIQAWAFGEDGKPLQGFKGGWGANKNGKIFFDGGACVEPEKLQPIAEPKDFDEFWKKAKAELAKVPIKAERKEIPYKKDPKIKLYAIKLDCAGPKPVTGYLSIPDKAKEKPMKGIVKFHGYGVRKHNPPGWVPNNAIVLDINAHGLTLGDDATFNEEKKKLGGYCFKNDENKKPETSYYYGMALRVLRALEYVKSLPEWNGKELHSNGGSQGGLQGLWGAGLDSDVTHSNIWSPWCLDLGGITLGRLKGWRPEYQPALNYFDPVFHAKRIKGKVHLIANYGDYVCPPSSVWIVYNNIPNDKKSMEVKQGCTHSYAMKKHQKYVITPQGTKDVGVSKK